MRINFDITFPDMPCAVVSLDAMDASGTASVDVLHNIFKRRLNADGEPIGDGARTGELKTLRSAEDLLKEKQKAIAEGRDAHTPAGGALNDPSYCGSCFGAGDTPEQCCNTCEEVREVYKKK
jgi:endoplasmic reticulum-Golgi intermediate compartment protein 3